MISAQSSVRSPRGWIADGHGYGAAFGLSAAVALIPTPFVLRAPETLIVPEDTPIPDVAMREPG